MGKSTISMAIFNSYVKLPEGMLYHRFFPHEAVVIIYYFGCLKLSQSITSLLPIGSMYAIYDNIYHQYTPILAYIPYMDPMGMVGNLRNISGPWNIRALSRRLMAKVISGLRDDCRFFFPQSMRKKPEKVPPKNPEIKISIGYIIHDIVMYIIHYIEMPQTLGCSWDHDSCPPLPCWNVTRYFSTRVMSRAIMIGLSMQCGEVQVRCPVFLEKIMDYWIIYGPYMDNIWIILVG